MAEKGGIQQKWQDEKYDSWIIALFLVILSIISLFFGFIFYIIMDVTTDILYSCILFSIIFLIISIYNLYQFSLYKFKHFILLKKYKNDYRKRQEYALEVFDYIIKSSNFTFQPVEIPSSFSYIICWSMIYSLSFDPYIHVSLSGVSNLSSGIEDYAIKIIQKSKSKSSRKIYQDLLMEIDFILTSFKGKSLGSGNYG